MKKHLVRLTLGLLLVLVFTGHAARFWQIPIVTLLDAYLYDVRLRLTMPQTLNEQVLIVDIDEKSLAEGGRWPWGRDKVATLVTQIFERYGAKVLGFDVVFAEPDESSGLKILEDLGRKRLKDEPSFQNALTALRPSLNYDQLLAQTLQGKPIVLGYYFSSLDDARQGGVLPPPVAAVGSFGKQKTPITSWSGYGANLPELQAAASSAGHFNPLIDFDGVARRVPMLVEHNGQYYEALSLAVLRQYLGGAMLHFGFPEKAVSLEWLDLVAGDRQYRVPVDDKAASLVPYRGHERSFRYVSAIDVLKGRLPPNLMSGKIVLVGTTAPGLVDLRSTPVGSTYPGVEIHANLIAGILNGDVKLRPSYSLGAEVIELLLVGVLLAGLLPLLSPGRASLLAGGSFVGLILFNLLLWHWGNLVFPLASALLLIALLFALNMSWGYFVESRSRRQFTELFGQYVPPELVDEMARDPERYNMEGRNAELTVLFSDVRDFTSLSEGLDPKELTQLMNEYLGVMTNVIRKYRGTLDKYIGDAIMAFWGAPMNDPEHARNAVLAALEMQQATAELSRSFRERNWPALRIGVGLNTGLMTVGDMGSPVRKAYTVMGDAVNLASRLEGLTKQYGVGLIVGQDTRNVIKDFAFRELDRVRVKGKDEPVVIYEPLGPAEAQTAAQKDSMRQWQQFLRLYRACDWEQAELQLVNLERLQPGTTLYRLYATRIQYLRAHPPGANWDGVTTFQNK